MRRLATPSSLLALGASAACHLERPIDAGAVAGGEGLAGRLAREGEDLARLLSSPEGLVLALVVVGVAVAFGALSRWVRLFRLRQGLAAGRLTTAGLALNVAGLVVVLAVSVRLLFAQVPLITSGVVLVAVAAALAALARQAPAWVAGLSLILRRGVHEGDRVKAGEAEGVVERVGLFRVVLRRPDGARLFLSVAALGGDAVVVASPLAEYPVEVVLGRSAPLSAADRQRIRALATLCPFRAARSDVVVTASGDDPPSCVVRFHSWSAAAAQHAEDYLRRALAGR